MVNIGSRCCNKFFPKMYELYGKRNLPGFWWVELIQSTQLCQLYFKCKRFMFLIEYFILFATVAKITKIVSFFPIPIATIVKEKNTFKKSLVRKFMVAKFGNIMNYFDWVPPIKLLNPLVTWSCKITRKPEPL